MFRGLRVTDIVNFEVGIRVDEPVDDIIGDCLSVEFMDRQNIEVGVIVT
jgi:hypothetical protein